MFDRWHHRYWRADEDAVRRADGKTPFVVVTGGSDGIGLELARLFGRSGRAVMLIARGADRLEGAARSLRSDGCARIETLALDVTSAGAIGAIDQAIAGVDGYVDVLVNSAGIGLSGAFADHGDDDVARLVDLNVRAVGLLARHYLAGMRGRGHGGLINLASLGGYAPGPCQATYYASKAFVISLTEALAFENRGQGVSIMVVAPGPVRTSFHGRMEAEGGLYLWLPLLSAEAVARAAFSAYGRRQWLVVPGVVNKAIMIAMRLTPHRLLMPIMEFLLDPRRATSRR